MPKKRAKQRIVPWDKVKDGDLYRVKGTMGRIRRRRHAGSYGGESPAPDKDDSRQA